MNRQSFGSPGFSLECMRGEARQPWHARCANWATALCAGMLLLGVSPASAMESNQYGLTGSYYSPLTAGQGLEMEIYKDLSGPGYGLLQAGWFTFDLAATGQQRWYTVSGPTFAGQSSVPVTIYKNIGGNFYAPPATTAQAVGTGVINFIDCGQAMFSYSFTDGSMKIGAEVLYRLTQNVTCVTTGTNGPTNFDFPLSGNYYDPTLSGQGVIMEVNNVSRVLFLTGYTYAVNGSSLGDAGQRWYTIQGAYTPGARSVSATIYDTTGGVFNAPTTPPPATVPVGDATVFFNTCQRITLTSNYTAGALAGRSYTWSLQRLGPIPPGCD